MKLSVKSYIKFLCTFIATIVTSVTFAYSADVSLRWDANEPAPEGYRVFVREDGQSFDYNHPIWEKSLSTCSLTGLIEGTTYYFVVRAFDGELESVDSEEVSYTPALVGADTDTGTDTDSGSDTSSDTDSDGDNVADVLDQFPADPDEWADNDGDGVGNNQDTDDDNDGMTDAWEIANGLDSLTDDAALDTDGDGVSNWDEFLADSDPTDSPNNVPPEAPAVETAVQTGRVELTPVLISGAYFDTDNDAHYQSRWQISTDSDFSSLVLDETSMIQLTAYTVGQIVLDLDTLYYWRVKYIDAGNSASGWSEASTFLTISAEDSDDLDINGIPDAQEVDELIDVNENDIADALEGTIMSVNTVEGETVVGVETISDNVTLVSIKSLPTDTIPDKSVKLAFGLVGFKLYLQDGVNTASVKIHFSKQVSKNAKLFKYKSDNGWEEYENAVFAPNGKSVTLVLEDGGVGDEDGVKNGVIVDPSGIADAYPSDSESATVSTGDVATGSSAGSSCFISTGTSDLSGLNHWTATVSMLMTMLLLGVGLLSAAVCQTRKHR